MDKIIITRKNVPLSRPLRPLTKSLLYAPCYTFPTFFSRVKAVFHHILLCSARSLDNFLSTGIIGLREPYTHTHSHTHSLTHTPPHTHTLTHTPSYKHSLYVSRLNKRKVFLSYDFDAYVIRYTYNFFVCET